MFHPVGHPMERGWVGRVDGDRVVHLAAQTLQSFFTGGGSAREHTEYRLDDVQFLAPVLHPPSVRIFDDQTAFAFANPAAIVGPDADVVAPTATLTLLPRLAAVVGASGAIGGFTAFADWRAQGLPAPKDRDFALGLGPTVVARDGFRPDGLGALVRVGERLELAGAFVGFDWTAARELAAERTVLHPGDVLVGPPLGRLDVPAGSRVELDVETIGVLAQQPAGE